MSLDTFNACVEGYTDRLFDNQIVAVQSGFWSGYYGNSRKPKPLKSIIKSMFKNRFKDDKKQKHVDTVDVEEFLRREAAFAAKLLEKEK